MAGELLELLHGFVADLIRGNESTLARRMRGRLLGTTCLIDTAVHVVNPKNLSTGHGCALYHGCYVLNPEGTFSMGNRSHLGAYCFVNVCQGRIVIGDDVAVGPGTKLIAYSNYFRRGAKVTEERVTDDIVIGDNVFVGANCTILPGATIEDNVVVGAGAVVKGVLETDGIYGGVPARLLRSGWYG